MVGYLIPTCNLCKSSGKILRAFLLTLRGMKCVLCYCLKQCRCRGINLSIIIRSFNQKLNNSFDIQIHNLDCCANACSSLNVIFQYLIMK